MKNYRVKLVLGDGPHIDETSEIDVTLSPDSLEQLVKHVHIVAPDMLETKNGNSHDVDLIFELKRIAHNNLPIQ